MTDRSIKLGYYFLTFELRLKLMPKIIICDNITFQQLFVSEFFCLDISGKIFSLSNIFITLKRIE